MSSLHGESSLEHQYQYLLTDPIMTCNTLYSTDVTYLEVVVASTWWSDWN